MQAASTPYSRAVFFARISHTFYPLPGYNLPCKAHERTRSVRGRTSTATNTAWSGMPWEAATAVKQFFFALPSFILYWVVGLFFLIFLGGSTSALSTKNKSYTGAASDKCESHSQFSANTNSEKYDEQRVNKRWTGPIFFVGVPYFVTLTFVGTLCAAWMCLRTECWQYLHTRSNLCRRRTCDTKCTGIGGRPPRKNRKVREGVNNFFCRIIQV